MLRLPRRTPIDILHSAADMKTMANRLSLLASNYLTRCVMNQNPLVTRAYDEFISFGVSRPRSRQTLFDPYLPSLALAKQIAGLAN